MINPKNVKLNESKTLVSFVVVCPVCRKEIVVNITPEEYYAYFVREEHVQTAMKDQSAEIRELCVSGICGECWNEMFEEEEDE
jgi:hypothetical protein